MSMTEKQQATVWRDIYEPGWREREAEHAAKFLTAVPVKPGNCAVRGQVEPRAMCGSYRVGGGCGFSGDCKHKG